jgi:REP element-mobilizing transposase RayT
MPNVSRLDPPGSFHHVMSHCVEGCHALKEDRFKADMMDRLSRLVGNRLLRIHAWALMDNHFHLLAEPVEATLSVAMHKLLTGFACAYNSRCDRRGHVFDARFRSILVEQESYYLKLISYIHLNPLKAGVVSSLQELSSYPWTGHSSITGACGCPWMSVEVTQALHGECGGDWRSVYLRLLESSLGNDDKEMESGNFRIWRHGLKEVSSDDHVPTGRSILVLGSRSFALSQFEKYKGLRRAGIRNRGDQHLEMEVASVRIALEYGIAQATMRSGGRGKRLSEARCKLIEELLTVQGVTQGDVASFLNISKSTVSYIMKKIKSDK